MPRFDQTRRGRALVTGLGLALLQAGCQSPSWFDGPAASTGPSSDTLEYVGQFRKVDTAGKGTITLDQATGYYSQLFTQLDINHDGFLTAQELQPMVPLMRAKTGDELLSMLDRNGDGKLSQKEFLVIANWLFQRAKSGDQMTLADAETGAARGIEKESKSAPDDKGGKGKSGPGPR